MEDTKLSKNTTSGNSPVALVQVIPPLGKIQVGLFEPAASIYKVFQDKEIKRLRRLPQLGQLTHIHSGAHHTRWDYIMLQLYLLKVFKEHSPGAGLASEVPCLGLGSGCQALQAYILLRMMSGGGLSRRQYPRLRVFSIAFCPRFFLIAWICLRIFSSDRPNNLPSSLADRHFPFNESQISSCRSGSRSFVLADNLFFLLLFCIYSFNAAIISGKE